MKLYCRCTEASTRLTAWCDATPLFGFCITAAVRKNRHTTGKRSKQPPELCLKRATYLQHRFRTSTQSRAKSWQQGKPKISWIAKVVYSMEYLNEKKGSHLSRNWYIQYRIYSHFRRNINNKISQKYSYTNEFGLLYIYICIYNTVHKLVWEFQLSSLQTIYQGQHSNCITKT